MKSHTILTGVFRLLLGLAFATAGLLRAQEAGGGMPVQYDQPQLDQLLGPIALYPDALVALILPASADATDIVLAARYLDNHGNPDWIDDQQWSESVRSLAHYPQVIKWMDQNLVWTRQLGSAFLNQPDEVMNTIQRLRVRARAAGTLTNTPQQQILLDGDDIEIIPAQPDVIYVPVYDPLLVYDRQPNYYGAPYISFGLGFPVGFWLSYDFNWRTRIILVGDRTHRDWREHWDWSHHPRPAESPSHSNNANWHQWQPPAHRPPVPRTDSPHPLPAVVRPLPFPGTTQNPPSLHSDERDRMRSESSIRITPVRESTPTRPPVSPNTAVTDQRPPAPPVQHATERDHPVSGTATRDNPTRVSNPVPPAVMQESTSQRGPAPRSVTPPSVATPTPSQGQTNPGHAPSPLHQAPPAPPAQTAPAPSPRNPPPAPPVNVKDKKDLEPQQR